jgi:hypothetical protein
MSRALIQLAAAVAFALVLWRAFRFAMGLRASRVHREDERRAQEMRGRRIVAEVPTREGGLYLFLESEHELEWQDHSVAKADLVGCRLILNGAVMATAVRPGFALPEPGIPEEFEGRERWDVRLYSRGGVVHEVPCGVLREGVSRETARAVFDAVSSTLHKSA